MVNKKHKKIIQEKRLNWLYLTAFFSLTSAGIVFAILCLAHSQIHFIVENATLWRILSVLFFFGLCGVSIFFSIMQNIFLSCLKNKYAEKYKNLIDFIKVNYTEKAIIKSVELIEKAYVMQMSNVNFTFILDNLLFNILKEKFLCK